METIVLTCLREIGNSKQLPLFATLIRWGVSFLTGISEFFLICSNTLKLIGLGAGLTIGATGTASKDMLLVFNLLLMIEG